MSNLPSNTESEHSGDLGIGCSSSVSTPAHAISQLTEEQVDGLVEYYRHHIEEAHLVLKYLHNQKITIELDDNDELTWAFFIDGVDAHKIVDHINE